MTFEMLQGFTVVLGRLYVDNLRVCSHFRDSLDSCFFNGPINLAITTLQDWKWQSGLCRAPEGAGTVTPCFGGRERDGKAKIFDGYLWSKEGISSNS